MTDKAENFSIADWLEKYTAGVGIPIPAVSKGQTVIQSCDNAVMSALMINRPKPVSAAQAMTESFSQHKMKLATWTR